MILNATEAVYQWLLFLRGKNGGIVRNRGFSLSDEEPSIASWKTSKIVIIKKIWFVLSLGLQNISVPMYPSKEFSKVQNHVIINIIINLKWCFELM